MLRLCTLILTALALSNGVHAQQEQLISPCPRLFHYEPQKDNDKWYGVVTLISDTDLKGVWLRLIFDRPSLQLGNWFGEIKTTDNVEYLIKNPQHQLKANMPYALRFYLLYNPNDPPPRLTAIRLNARTVCPEGESTTPTAITGGNQLITSAPFGGVAAGAGGAINNFQTSTSTTPVPSSGSTFVRPGGGWAGPATNTGTDDDDFFAGDFQLINKPHLRPTVEPECGTVVKLDADVRIRQKRARTPNFPQVEFQTVYYTDQQRGNSSWQDFIRHVMMRQQKPPTLAPPDATTWSSSSTVATSVRQTKSPLPTTTAAPKKQQQQKLEVIAPLEQQPRPLITHGQGTREGEFPWHVALYHERGADLQYICGASLISSRHVITVAHCVTRRRSATTLNPDSLVVYLGKYYLKKWSNPGIQDSQVATIFAHPQYNSNTYANDIAILKLVNPIVFTDYVRPVCLWGDGSDLNGVLNKPGTVVGWGFDHTGKVTEELTQAKMPVVTKETCIYSFPDFFSRFTTSKTYCAGFRNGTSVCNGDSGGGMVFPKQTGANNRQVWQLRGLVSISVALQNQFKCDSSHYVVFTDVAKYLDWISEAMQK